MKSIGIILLFLANFSAFAADSNCPASMEIDHLPFSTHDVYLSLNKAVIFPRGTETAYLLGNSNPEQSYLLITAISKSDNVRSLKRFVRLGEAGSYDYGDGSHSVYFGTYNSEKAIAKIEGEIFTQADQPLTVGEIEKLGNGAFTIVCNTPPVIEM